MTASGLDIPFDRVTYRDGQLLDARDLRDDHLSDTRLRRLMFSVSHDTWGIALGFEVIQLNDKREQVETDGTAVVVLFRVMPWIASAESAVADPTQPLLPNVSGRVVLTVGYRADSEFRALQNLCERCVSTVGSTRATSGSVSRGAGPKRSVLVPRCRSYK